MPIYQYSGLNSKGDSVTGVVEAENQKTAIQKLKRDGIFITRMSDQKKKQAQKKNTVNITSISSRVPLSDLSLMTRQLATLVKANIPLLEALTALADQTENPTLKNTITEIKNAVAEGSSLHAALKKFPKIFDPIFTSMAEAGEKSGSLDTILMRLAEVKEAQDNLQSKVRGALVYPIIMLVVTTGLLLFLFVFVIPQVTQVFESFPEITLPWVTVATIGISGFIINNWLWLLLGALGAIVFFNQWRETEEGKKIWHAWCLKFPLFGALNRTVAVARFTRTLETLMNGGVPVLEALRIVRNVVNNEVIGEAIDKARENISEGQSIAQPLRDSQQFPPIVIHMISVGERTGELQAMLTRVSDAFEFQVKNKVETITGLIAPLVLVFMGVVIAIIVFAVLLPMFELNKLGDKALLSLGFKPPSTKSRYLPIGFTLLEILIVLAILSGLTILGITSLRKPTGGLGAIVIELSEIIERARLEAIQQKKFLRIGVEKNVEKKEWFFTIQKESSRSSLIENTEEKEEEEKNSRRATSAGILFEDHPSFFRGKPTRHSFATFELKSLEAFDFKKEKKTRSDESSTLDLAYIYVSPGGLISGGLISGSSSNQRELYVVVYPLTGTVFLKKERIEEKDLFNL